MLDQFGSSLFQKNGENTQFLKFNSKHNQETEKILSFKKKKFNMSILLYVDLSSKNKQILKDLMSIGDES